jgi:hypothetical protein
LYTFHTRIPCHARISSYVGVAPSRGCATHAPGRACMRARARMCAWAPASAPTRAITSRRRRFSRRRLAGVRGSVGRQREHRRVEHRTSLGLVLCMRRFRPARAPRRTALGRSSTHAQPSCAAASPMCVWPRERLRAHVAIHIRVYVGGSPIYTHFCSSAIAPSKSWLSMSNAHMRIGLLHSVDTQISTSMSISRARVCVCVRVGVCQAARCMRAKYDNLSMLSRKFSIAVYRYNNLSGYVRIARVYTHHCLRASVCGRELPLARACVRRSLPCVPTCPCARADGTALPFMCASTVCPPYSRGQNTPMDRIYIHYIHTYRAMHAYRRVWEYRRGVLAPHCVRAQACVHACMRAR